MVIKRIVPELQNNMSLVPEETKSQMLIKEMTFMLVSQKSLENTTKKSICLS